MDNENCSVNLFTLLANTHPKKKSTYVAKLLKYFGLKIWLSDILGKGIISRCCPPGETLVLRRVAFNYKPDLWSIWMKNDVAWLFRWSPHGPIRATGPSSQSAQKGRSCSRDAPNFSRRWLMSPVTASLHTSFLLITNFFLLLLFKLAHSSMRTWVKIEIDKPHSELCKRNRQGLLPEVSPWHPKTAAEIHRLGALDVAEKTKKNEKRQKQQKSPQQHETRSLRERLCDGWILDRKTCSVKASSLFLQPKKQNS